MANTAHTEAHGGSGGFPPFQKDTFASQLLWLALAFIALYVLASRFALPRIGAIVEGRANRIAGDLAEAQRLKEQSDSALGAYEKELAAARGKAQAMATETRDRLHAETEASRKSLDDSLNARLAEAEKAVAKTRADAMANVQAIAADAASAIVQQLTGKAPEAAAVTSAVTAAVKG